MGSAQLRALPGTDLRAAGVLGPLREPRRPEVGPPGSVRNCTLPVFRCVLFCPLRETGSPAQHTPKQQ
eukprot:4061167-Alexandrium_andersonii.AAC.1